MAYSHRERWLEEVDDAPARDEGVVDQACASGAEPASIPRPSRQPPLAVKALIAALVHAPRSLFHPVLLGSEVVQALGWTKQTTEKLCGFGLDELPEEVRRRAFYV